MRANSEIKPEARRKVVKHSLSIARHRTSISLEAPFWDEVKRIAEARGQSVASLIAAIDAELGSANLSSAIRTFVLEAVRRPPDRANT